MVNAGCFLGIRQFDEELRHVRAISVSVDFPATFNCFDLNMFTLRPGFPGLKRDFYVHEQLLSHFLPRLHAHFEAESITTSAYATKV